MNHLYDVIHGHALLIFAPTKIPCLCGKAISVILPVAKYHEPANTTYIWRIIFPKIFFLNDWIAEKMAGVDFRFED